MWIIPERSAIAHLKPTILPINICTELLYLVEVLEISS